MAAIAAATAKNATNRIILYFIGPFPEESFGHERNSNVVGFGYRPCAVRIVGRFLCGSLCPGYDNH